MSFKQEINVKNGVWSINGMPPEQVQLLVEKQPAYVKRNMLIVAGMIGSVALVLCTIFAIQWRTVDLI